MWYIWNYVTLTWERTTFEHIKDKLYEYMPNMRYHLITACLNSELWYYTIPINNRTCVIKIMFIG